MTFVRYIYDDNFRLNIFLLYFTDRARPSGLVFGLTLEKCIDNDQTCNKPPVTDTTQAPGRVSRNSISSLGDNNIRNVSRKMNFKESRRQ